MHSVLQLLGLAKRGGFIALGESPVTQALKDGSAVLVFAASDAAENSRRKLGYLAEGAEVPLVPIAATKAEFGAAFGRESLAMAALSDAGLALSVLRKIDPEGTQYPEAAEAIQRRLPRKKRRKMEHSK